MIKTILIYDFKQNYDSFLGNQFFYYYLHINQYQYISRMDIFIISIALLILIFAFIYAKFMIIGKRKYQNYSKKLKQLGYRVYQIPYQPFKFPIFEGYKTNEITVKDSYYPEKRIYPGYDLVLSNILSTPMILVTTSSLAKELMKPENVFNLPKINLALHIMNLLMGKGLVFNENQEWKNKRKILSNIFNFNFIKAQVPNIPSICDFVYKQMESKSRIEHSNLKQDQFECQIVKLNVNIFGIFMLNCFFGNSHIEDKIKGLSIPQFTNDMVAKAYAFSSDVLLMLFGMLAFNLKLKRSYGQYQKNLAQLHEILNIYINETYQSYKKKSQKEKQESHTIIELVFYEKEKRGQDLTSAAFKSEIIHEYITFIIAGSDTSSNFMSMMLFLIFENPEVQNRLRKQIKQKIKNIDEINFQELKSLTYIDYIQNEATRMIGPAAGIFVREAQQDFMLKNIPIQKGTALNYSNLSIHHNPKVYTNPYQFRPERWEEECKNIDPFDLIGFSSGPRNCIGKQLAHLSSKIVLIKFMARYKNLTELEKPRVLGISLVISPKTEKIRLLKN